MARARNIKPSLFKNELLGEADPLITILFTGLWCLADKAGRLEDRPKRIKAEIFPYRELPLFNGYLTELERMGFIQRYEVDGRAFIQVVNFTKHQAPHKTERESDIPEPPVNTGLSAITVKQPLNNESLTVTKHLIPDSLIPDSLIPDSSNTDLKPIVGKPDSMNSKPVEKFESVHDPDGDTPESIIEYLNRAVNARYRPVASTLRLIMARMKEGHSAQNLKAVIDFKAASWLNDPKMSMYLRPATLFNAEKFNQYVGQVGKSPPKTSGQLLEDWAGGVNQNDDFLIGELDYARIG